MKTNHHVLFLIPVLTTVSVFLIGCATGIIQKSEYGSKSNCENRLLIAAQKSDYKNEVISKITTTLEDEYCYLRVVDIQELCNERAEDYKAIAIIDRIKMMGISEESQTFIDRSADKSKFSVLATKGGDLNYEFDDVDAVTCASDIQQSEDAIDSLISDVRMSLENTY